MDAIMLLQSDRTNLIKHQLKTGLANRVVSREIKPEECPDLENKVTLFGRPVYNWTPENALKKQQVPCPICNACVPRVLNGAVYFSHGLPKLIFDVLVKEYLSREGEVHEYKVDILYIGYACTNPDDAVKNTRFNTLCQEFMDLIGVALANRFTFILSHKHSFANDLFEDLHYAILAPNGLKPYLDTLKTRRMNRYMSLTIRLNDLNECPDPNQADPSTISFQDAWLKLTHPYEALARATMAMSYATHAISFDATAKFPAKLKVKEVTTNKFATPSHMKLLNIVQNKIGQIMDASFIASESHESLGPILKEVKDNMAALDRGPTVTDNIGANRSIINNKMGQGYVPKQDPFHIMQSWKLSEAMYLSRDHRQHREPTQAAMLFQMACDEVPTDKLKAGSVDEWAGTVRNNVTLIRNGDAYALNAASKARMQSSRLPPYDPWAHIPGQRMLYFLVLEQNLECAARAGRWPDLQNMDLLNLIKMTLICNDRIPHTPQTTFALAVLQKVRSLPTARSIRVADGKKFEVSDWNAFNFIFRPAAAPVQNTAPPPPANQPSVKHFWTTAIPLAASHSPRKRTTTQQFLKFLDLQPEDITRQTMNGNEHSLLLKTLQFQLNLPREGNDDTMQSCPPVLTLLYNAAVAGLGPDARKLDPSTPDDVKLKVQFRSLDTIETIVTDTLTSFETSFTEPVFDALYSMDMTFKKKRFHYLLNLASLLIADFRRRTEEATTLRWNALRSKRNNQAATSRSTTPLVTDSISSGSEVQYTLPAFPSSSNTVQTANPDDSSEHFVQLQKLKEADKLTMPALFNKARQLYPTKYATTSSAAFAQQFNRSRRRLEEERKKGIVFDFRLKATIFSPCPIALPSRTYSPSISQYFQPVALEHFRLGLLLLRPPPLSTSDLDFIHSSVAISTNPSGLSIPSSSDSFPAAIPTETRTSDPGVATNSVGKRASSFADTNVKAPKLLKTGRSCDYCQSKNRACDGKVPQCSRWTAPARSIGDMLVASSCISSAATSPTTSNPPTLNNGDRRQEPPKASASTSVSTNKSVALSNQRKSGRVVACPSCKRLQITCDGSDVRCRKVKPAKNSLKNNYFAKK
ncbi:hypothetical protein DFS34DRAFT_675127 [Phlyctochytrium arcticum]|nr:hypothetical protein DFS34DRAFT_675127 [Phlyctochytrium arcticum]